MKTINTIVVKVPCTLGVFVCSIIYLNEFKVNGASISIIVEKSLKILMLIIFQFLFVNVERGRFMLGTN